MIYFGVVLGLIIMAVMIYMALDKKSSLATRKASLIALAVMILTVIICLFIVLTDDRISVDESMVIVGVSQEEHKDVSGNVLPLLLLVVFLLGIFALIARLAFKEHKKKTGVLA